MVVDLPAPFGPRNPNVSPAATSKSMPRTASTSPYRLVSSLTEIAGPRWAGLRWAGLRWAVGFCARLYRHVLRPSLETLI